MNANLKNILAVMLVTLAAFATYAAGSSGSSGHDKADRPAKILEKSEDGYKYTLSVKPENPTAGRDIQFEIDIVKEGGDDILGGAPVEGAKVYFQYNGHNEHSKKHLGHSEHSGGVYGHHFKFHDSGAWQIAISGETGSGHHLGATFIVHVEGAQDGHNKDEGGDHHEEKNDDHNKSAGDGHHG